MSLVGRSFSDRYEIQRELAQGGMAEVYLAHDQLLDRPVALKALFPEYAREPSFVERFRREAQSAANLNHPNIVAIYDWGQEAGTYFIVMEYVEGQSLRELIRAEGPLDAFQAAEITAEIASALAFAHRTGVVHRDVKPGNVLITQTGIVKVTDFGIARAGTSDGLTQTGSVMGTATYFSPEQAQGLPVDGRSDVYSLGVVLYEMITGVAPFTGDSPVAVAYKHVREAPVPPSRRNPDVPPDLEQIILTAMAKDPDLRYQSADDMRADLLRFRRGRPLAAAPVTALIAEGSASATVVNPRVAAAYAGTAPADTGMVTPVRSRRRRWIYTALTVLVLAAIVGVIVFVAQVAGKNSDKVSVPKVVGTTQAAATAQLQGLGFTVKASSAPNPAVPAGVVVQQNPAEGALLKKGDTVHLVVSSGKGQVQITNVTGQNANDAQRALEAQGLTVTKSTEASDTVPLLSVIRTVPAAGTAVPGGSTVNMVLSSGPSQVPVPNVLSEDATTAAAQLGQQGFSVQTQNEASKTVPLGQVIRTNPGPNQLAPKGSSVTIVVSTGPQQVAVPVVNGLTQAAAEAAVSAAGLVPVVSQQPSTPANAGLVIGSNPGQGTMVAAGSTVVLLVGTSSPTTTAPHSTTTT
jgi:eukaryotic-like serine/threonine-protein kinase